MKRKRPGAWLALEDGTLFKGASFGAAGESVGEVVFNTAMCGYQEVLTDPSYHRQIVTMTYPQIGNYGINDTDRESERIQVAGFVVREVCRHPSNFTSSMSVEQYLRENGVVAVEGIDTRALTRHIRARGAMKAVVYSEEACTGDLVEKARSWQGFDGYDAVSRVTCGNAYRWDGRGVSTQLGRDADRPHVVAMDFGVKFNILRLLHVEGFDVTVVPANAPAETILSYKPDGLFLSNGPGDPAAVGYAVDTIRALRGKLPIFGICLGHQLLCLALGGASYKLKFGHRGANHPVKDLRSDRIEITSQNHGYCIDIDSLTGKGIEMTHLNLNDHTCEGVVSEKEMVMSVQYHPES
ncbi:glutamine-hydrolyzing carbamoyl-phosphate synthase small subunit, partial [bacterium]|nr:glutamine-hydrolyzing carbamoyl-phosphate synthase small subunit [bacterium]MBD3239365.1 glutamine-hydrolyzing carbamoyl-phosphate synthase small subunit [Chitinivibrionales bacterium]